MAKTGQYVVELGVKGTSPVVQEWIESGNLNLDYDGPFFKSPVMAKKLALGLHEENGLIYRVRNTHNAREVIAVYGEAPTRLDVVKAIVAKVQYPDYVFSVVEAGELAIFVQGSYWEPDTVTGIQELQKTRLWLVADTDTEDEIVRTLFKVIMTSAEHKAREHFKYEGYSIMNPHFSVQQYVAIMQAKDVRSKEAAHTCTVCGTTNVTDGDYHKCRPVK